MLSAFIHRTSQTTKRRMKDSKFIIGLRRNASQSQSSLSPSSFGTPEIFDEFAQSVEFLDGYANPHPDTEPPFPSDVASDHRDREPSIPETAFVHRTSFSPQLEIRFSEDSLSNWFPPEMLSHSEEGVESSTDNPPGMSHNLLSSSGVPSTSGTRIPPGVEQSAADLSQTNPSTSSSFQSKDTIEARIDQMRAPSRRLAPPAPIQIPKAGPKIPTMPSPPAGRSHLSLLVFPQSPPVSPSTVSDGRSSNSGTALARALIANTFILSADPHGSLRSRPGGGVRLDSATLPRADEPYAVELPLKKDWRIGRGDIVMLTPEEPDFVPFHRPVRSASQLALLSMQAKQLSPAPSTEPQHVEGSESETKIEIIIAPEISADVEPLVAQSRTDAPLHLHKGKTQQEYLPVPSVPAVVSAALSSSASSYSSSSSSLTVPLLPIKPLRAPKVKAAQANVPAPLQLEGVEGAMAETQRPVEREPSSDAAAGSPVGDEVVTFESLRHQYNLDLVSPPVSSGSERDIDSVLDDYGLISPMRTGTSSRSIPSRGSSRANSLSLRQRRESQQDATRYVLSPVRRTRYSSTDGRIGLLGQTLGSERRSVLGPSPLGDQSFAPRLPLPSNRPASLLLPPSGNLSSVTSSATGSSGRISSGTASTTPMSSAGDSSRPPTRCNSMGTTAIVAPAAAAPTTTSDPAGTSTFDDPPPRAILTRNRAGSIPNPITVVRDSKDPRAYNLTVSPESLDLAESPLSSGGRQQTFPETPNEFSPVFSPPARQRQSNDTPSISSVAATTGGDTPAARQSVSSNGSSTRGTLRTSLAQNVMLSRAATSAVEARPGHIRRQLSQAAADLAGVGVKLLDEQRQQEKGSEESLISQLPQAPPGIVGASLQRVLEIATPVPSNGSLSRSPSPTLRQPLTESLPLKAPPLMSSPAPSLHLPRVLPRVLPRTPDPPATFGPSTNFSHARLLSDASASDVPFGQAPPPYDSVVYNRQEQFDMSVVPPLNIRARGLPLHTPDSSPSRVRNRPRVPLGPRGPIQPLEFSGTTPWRSRNESNDSTISSTSSATVVGVPTHSGSSTNSNGSTSGSQRPRLSIPTSAPGFHIPPPKWRALRKDVVNWEFSQQQLQTTVSNAIRKSAEPSFIRLLYPDHVEEGIPREVERLQALSLDIRNNYKLRVRQRSQILSRHHNQLSGQDHYSGMHHVKEIVEISLILDSLTEELYSVEAQLAQLRSLCDVHWASALAIALHKIHKCFSKQADENRELQRKVESLEAERDEAWKQAVDVAEDFDVLNDKVLAESSATPNRDDHSPPRHPPSLSRRSSMIMASRKSSMIATKAGLRKSHSRRSLRSSAASGSLTPSGGLQDDVPPVPPMPLLIAAADFDRRSRDRLSSFSSPETSTGAIGKGFGEMLMPEPSHGRPRSRSLTETRSPIRPLHTRAISDFTLGQLSPSFMAQDLA